LFIILDTENINHLKQEDFKMTEPGIIGIGNPDHGKREEKAVKISRQ